MEFIVGVRCRRRVTRRVVQAPVGSPQAGDRLRVERRRLQDRGSLEYQQRRYELAQLGRVEQIGLAQMLGERLDVRIARSAHGRLAYEASRDRVGEQVDLAGIGIAGKRITRRSRRRRSLDVGLTVAASVAALPAIIPA